MKNKNGLAQNKIGESYRKSRFLIFGVLVVTLLSMTIGHSANLSSLLTMIGHANLDVTEGMLEITSITNTSSVNATSNGVSDYIDSSSTDEEIILAGNFNVNFYRTGGSGTTSITYQLQIYNGTFSKKTLESIESSPTLSTGNISNYSYSIFGATAGVTVIEPGKTVTVTVTLSLANTSRNTTYRLNETIKFKFKKNPSNTLNFTPVLETRQVRFTDFTSSKEIKILLLNNADSNVTYNLTTTNSNFQFVDSNGNLITQLSVDSKSQKSEVVYLKIADNHVFVTESDDVPIMLTTTSPKILTYELGVIKAYTPDGGAKLILKNQTINSDTSIDFTAIQNVSGVFKNTVTGESTYFYRGAVNNNYVSFAGYIWRIIKIDKYGTRVVLDSVLPTQSQWATSNTTTNLASAISLLSYENSLVKPVVDSWYNENLSSYSDIIKTGLYCEDFNYQSLTSSGSGYSTYYFGSYIRNGPDSAGYTPEFVCPSEYTHSYNIGLMSGDEVTFAGGLFRADNTSYYLYNPNITNYWWTLSPSYYDTTLRTVGILIVNGSTGHFHDWQNGSTIANANAIRPVITLDTDRLSGGTGIVGDEYRFS